MSTTVDRAGGPNDRHAEKYAIRQGAAVCAPIVAIFGALALPTGGLVFNFASQGAARPDVIALATSIYFATRAELIRAHNNALANQALIIGMMERFPAMEMVNQWRGDLMVRADAENADEGVNHAMAITERTLWKQDIMVRCKGLPNEERVIMPGGHPRLVVGDRTVQAEPGSKELLLAELVVKCVARCKVRVDFRALVVRVAADAYNAARQSSHVELRAGYGEERYATMFDAGRRMLRVTSESLGAVRIYSLQHLEQGRGLRQREVAQQSRRLPVEKVVDVTSFTDSHMKDFGIETHLQGAASELGLQAKYDELKDRHRWQRERPIG